MLRNKPGGRWLEEGIRPTLQGKIKAFQCEDWHCALLQTRVGSWKSDQSRALISHMSPHLHPCWSYKQEMSFSLLFFSQCRALKILWTNRKSCFRQMWHCNQCLHNRSKPACLCLPKKLPQKNTSRLSCTLPADMLIWGHTYALLGNDNDDDNEESCSHIIQHPSSAWISNSILCLTSF